MKGYLGFGRCTEICATGEWNGSFSALATAGAVGQLLRTLVLLALLTWSAAPARAGHWQRTSFLAQFPRRVGGNSARIS